MFARYQKGLSPIGVLMVVCIFAFFVVCALKLTPHYIDFSAIKSVYEEVNGRADLNNRSPQDIYDAISRSLTINSLGDFDIKGSTVLSRETGQMKVGLDYEVREKLFGNISVVLTFQYVPE